MNDVNTKLKKTFESLNKNLYRTNKALELYAPVSEIFNCIASDVKEIETLFEKNKHLEKEIEDEIKKRELISLYKKMHAVVSQVKDEIDYLYKDMNDANRFLENFRCYRTYIFQDSKKTQDFLKKLIETFSVENFTLKFNVVGTIDLADVANRVQGKKTGIDIVFPSDNINLIFEEVLKSQTNKFRLITEKIAIYFEKENIIYIEGPSQSIKFADGDAKQFNAQVLEN